jgi:hypothetical protein
MKREVFSGTAAIRSSFDVNRKFEETLRPQAGAAAGRFSLRNAVLETFARLAHKTMTQRVKCADRKRDTLIIQAPKHVERAPRRCEAVTPSGRGQFIVGRGGKVRPGPGKGVVNVQVVEEVACEREREGRREREGEGGKEGGKEREGETDRQTGRQTDREDVACKERDAQDRARGWGFVHVWVSDCVRARAVVYV